MDEYEGLSGQYTIGTDYDVLIKEVADKYRVRIDELVNGEVIERMKTHSLSNGKFIVTFKDGGILVEVTTKKNGSKAGIFLNQEDMTKEDARQHYKELLRNEYKKVD
jgi:hypothetical protein